MKYIRFDELTNDIELLHTLENIGIRIDLKREPGYLLIDEEKLYQSLHRNAGRKKKTSIRKGKPNDLLTLSELANMRKDNSMEQIAAMYGISRRTLYRRLREAKERGIDYIY